MRVFGEGELLDTTPQAFTLLSDGYACDDKHVFWRNRLLNVDRNSFKVLEDGYAEDKYHYIYRMVVTKKKDVEANHL